MGGPARGAISDATAGLNCLFAMRRFCPMIEISHTYDKAILVGQTLETENTSYTYEGEIGQQNCFKIRAVNEYGTIGPVSNQECATGN